MRGSNRFGLGFLFCILVVLARPALAEIDTSFMVSAETCALVSDFSTLTCAPDLPEGACATARARKQSECADLERSPFLKFLYKLLEETEKNLFEVLSAIIIAGLAFFTLKIRAAAARLQQRVGDPFFTRPATFENRAINVIMIGEGGSGKTTLIHALTGSDEANPEIATDSYATYSIVLEINVNRNNKESRDVYRIYVDDYVGQRFASAVKNPNLDLRRKTVQASLLLIVVDLFSPDWKPKNGQSEIYDKERVKEQIEFYGEGVIQIVADLLGAAQQIVLFINKVDAIRTDKDVDKLVRAAYDPLIAKLKQIRGKQVSVVVGSARTGQGVVGYDDGDSKRRSLAKIVLDTAERFDNQLGRR